MARAHINQFQLARRVEVSEDIIRDVFDVITACMEEGVAVRIRGFGTFRPDIVPERTVRSPVVPEGRKRIGRHRTIRFRISKALKRQWTSPLTEESGT